MNIITAQLVRLALAAMKPRPCLDVYPGDWLRDDIAGCSIAANGFWFRSMFIMHGAKPYGHLVDGNGNPLEDREIVRRVGLKNLHEFRALLEEITAKGIPGKSGDEAYLQTISLEHAAIEVGGVEWHLDLSPLSVATSGVIYSRRMLRDRRLAVIRFFVSPKGQILIRQNPDLTTQTSRSRARAGAEEEDEIGSLSQSTKSLEGGQREGSRPMSETLAITARLMPLFEASALRDKPPEGIVHAWIRDRGYDEALIRETLTDCEAQYAGKGWRYFEQILATRHADPSQRPAGRTRRPTALKGENGNGSGASKPRPDFGHKDGNEILRQRREQREREALQALQKPPS